MTIEPARSSGRGALMGVGSPEPLSIGGGEPAVLALHGWSGTPQEVALVVEIAGELGLRAHAPLLPGHGTHARDLADKTFADWSRSAEDALDRVGAKGPAIVAGLSMGALLAMHLAVAHPARVRALVLLANAAWLTAPFPALALAAADRTGIKSFTMPKKESDIADPEMRRTNLTYSAQPVRSAIEVLRAGERMRRELGRIRCPVFIGHGLLDRVCPVSNARKVAERLGTTDRTVVVLPRSRHIITRDYDRAVLRDRLKIFIERFAEEPRAPDIRAPKTSRLP